jgi:hypothetical protein
VIDDDEEDEDMDDIASKRSRVEDE